MNVFDISCVNGHGYEITFDYLTIRLIRWFVVGGLCSCFIFSSLKLQILSDIFKINCPGETRISFVFCMAYNFAPRFMWPIIFDMSYIRITLQRKTISQNCCVTVWFKKLYVERDLLTLQHNWMLYVVPRIAKIAKNCLQ